MMRQVIRVSGILTMVALGGCKTSTYNPTYFGAAGGGMGYGQPGMGPGTTGQAGPPAQGAMGQVQAADRVLRTQGYAPVSQLMQADLNERQLTSFPFMGQPGYCYSVFAIGDGNAREVDMAIANPSGQPVVHDNESGNHPNGSFCASEFGMHFARITLLQGTGRVYFGMYQGPPGSTSNLASVFDSNAEVMGQTTDRPDDATQARITAVQTQWAGQGYQMAKEPQGFTMRAGQTATWPTTLYQGWCYSFATFAGQGAQNSDLILQDASGTRRVGADVARDPDAALREICPDATQSYQLRPRLTRGQGAVWFLAMARKNETTPTNTTDPGTQPQSSGNAIAISTQLTVQSSSAEGLGRNLERDWLAIGYASAGASQSGTLTASGEQTYPFELETGKCYALAAAGVDSVQDLELSLTGPSGAVIDKYLGHDAKPNIRVCPTASGSYQAKIKMAAGEGAIRVSLFRWTEGTEGAGMRGLMFVRTAEITRLLRADGYTGDSSIDPYRGDIRAGNTVTRNISLENGVCYAMVAVGGDGVSGLDLKVQKGSSTVGHEESFAAFPASRFCARSGGSHRIEIKSMSGSGPVSFRVYRREAAGSGS